MAIEKIIALDNIDKVVNNEETPLDAVVELDITTAEAYQDIQAAAKHVTEVIETLMDTAEDVILDAPETPEVKAENIYTKKLTLDESMEDFIIKEAKTRFNDDADRYVEYDMFHFIYDLFSSETDSLVRPLKALSNTKSGRGRKKATDTGSAFMYQGSDDYNDETGDGGVKGVSQVSTDSDGNVVVYQDHIEDFDKVIELCNEYQFKFEGPDAKKAPWLRWNYSLKIFVPVTAKGYPMEVEDYFASINIPLEQVMPASFIKGREKDYKKLDDETVVEVTLKKYIHKAGSSNDPLEGFLRSMFKELNAAKVKYDKKDLERRFMAEFQDDFDLDEE